MQFTLHYAYYIYLYIKTRISCGLIYYFTAKTLSYTQNLKNNNIKKKRRKCCHHWHHDSGDTSSASLPTPKTNQTLVPIYSSRIMKSH